MEYFEAHWAEFCIGGILLWAGFSVSELSTNQGKAELALDSFSDEENWSSFQKNSIYWQISINSSQKKAEIGLGAILSIMVVLAFKLII